MVICKRILNDLHLIRPSKTTNIHNSVNNHFMTISPIISCLDISEKREIFSDLETKVLGYLKFDCKHFYFRSYSGLLLQIY